MYDQKAYDRQYYIKNRTKIYARHMKLRKAHRLEIIQLLGGKCRCGFSDSRALQIDHVNGNGTHDPVYRARRQDYAKLKQAILNGSKDYQLLCANCNWIKRVENGETN